MGRRSTFSQHKADLILERLRAGCTRRAASESIGVPEQTLSRWFYQFREFRESVSHAEAEAEVKHTATMMKAATGWEAGSTTTTRKTVFRVKKTRRPDGTVIEEPVAFEEVTTSEARSREFDWRAALEWLKRRRRNEWGDGLEVKIQHMKPDELRDYILGRAGAGHGSEAPESSGDWAALREAADPAPDGAEG